MVRTRVNPFVPGRGALPPYLAGRETEKRTLMEMLAYVEDSRGAPRDVVLCGPRGNGKTVLLRWFQREVDARGGRIDLLWRTPGDMPDVDSLATTLVPPGRFKSLLPDTLSLTVCVRRVGWELGNSTGTLAELLTLRCRQRPLVVLLDEAHTLDPVVGQALLNASQSASAQAPFLLVLAGTPELEPQLNAMSATFWDRAEQMAIGLLDRPASAAALTRPFEVETPPVAFEAKALGTVLDDSQCYPYFLQLFGAALWDAVATSGRTTIGDADVARAARAFRRRQRTYYHHRRNELERGDLLDVAGRVARAFEGRDTIVQNEVDAAIADAVGARGADVEASHTQRIIAIRDELSAVGYIWNPAGEQDAWRAGIPSLMAYIENPTG